MDTSLMFSSETDKWATPQGTTEGKMEGGAEC